MKKLISLLLAVLMAVTGALVCAQAAPLPSMTIANTVTFDRDACRKIMTDMGLNADQIEVVESTLALIEASGQNLVLVKDGFEYNMILGGNTVFTAAGDFTPEGVAIGSNLFPHYILTVSNDTIADMQARFNAKAQAEEKTEAEGTSAGLLPELVAQILQNSEELQNVVSSRITIGEPELGEYTVDGDAYNAMIPVSIDTRGIADDAVGIADRFIHSEPVVKLQGILRKVDIDLPLKTPAFGAVPAVNATVYRNQDEAGELNGPMYVSVGIAATDGAAPMLSASVRLDGDNVRVRFGIPGVGLDVTYEQFWSTKGGFVRLDVSIGERYYALALEAALGVQSHLSFNVYYLDPSTPLVSDDIAVSPGGKRQYAVEGWGKTPLSVEGLISGEEKNGSWISLLADVALYSAIEIMSARNQSQPEVLNLIGLLLGA